MRIVFAVFIFCLSTLTKAQNDKTRLLPGFILIGGLTGITVEHLIPFLTFLSKTE